MCTYQVHVYHGTRTRVPYVHVYQNLVRTYVRTYHGTMLCHNFLIRTYVYAPTHVTYHGTKLVLYVHVYQWYHGTYQVHVYCTYVPTMVPWYVHVYQVVVRTHGTGLWYTYIIYSYGNVAISH